MIELSISLSTKLDENVVTVTCWDVVTTNVIGNCTNIDFHNNNHRWIIDSGAPPNICCFKQLYHSRTSIPNSHVLLSNSTKVKVKGIGSIKLNEYIFFLHMCFIFLHFDSIFSLCSL